ncbi:cobyric acid synthase [Isachenkonia alkalipeptolytica]|nr:cobyric acid synthase [Isachenkonia alkalipeptolytica]
MGKNIMFQGTGSSVGKSLLTAGLCRALFNRGYAVAPFKSQNMALNSFITKDGKEMGRAQVVQAEAAGIEPSVEMNPILLKPTSQVGSQVIIEGKVYGNLDAKAYQKEKVHLKKKVHRTYQSLSKKYEAVIIEGAGSPAEINLREHDLVNMGLAEMVDAPVILVGDIDRGGVFASIYGTVMLLEPQEQRRIKGFIINKFRGDVEILKPGIRMMEEKVGIPCLGVMPYDSFMIEDEDSVTNRFEEKASQNKPDQGNALRENQDGSLSKVKIGVIKLPFISNFTDFLPLETEQEVLLTYIQDPKDCEDLDLLIIPGSKNTLHDRKFLIEKGFDERIYPQVKKGSLVMGICGGYQILGSTLRDDHQVESGIAEINGLGLLDIDTVMEKEKTTRQITGRSPLFQQKIEGMSLKREFETIITGYEIHMGRTTRKEGTSPWISLEDGSFDGSIDEKNQIFGTYLHGIFENDDFRRDLIGHLKKKRILDTTEGKDFISAVEEAGSSFKELKNQEYNRLATMMEEYVDMDALLRVMGW